MGRYDSLETDKYFKFVDRDIYAKFYKRFPSLKAMPKVYSFTIEKGTNAYRVHNPIFEFVEKYKELKKKGYSEYKAFSIVEKELTAILED